jgi:hypothetical protein
MSSVTLDISVEEGFWDNVYGYKIQAIYVGMDIYIGQYW